MRKERVGFAVCGSFCTHEKVLKALEALTEIYETVIPIVSEISALRTPASAGPRTCWSGWRT